MIGKHHKDARPTEMAGAKAVAGKIAIMWDNVMALFAAAGERGLTDYELTQAYQCAYGTGLRHSLGARRFELVEQGRLAPREKGDDNDRRPGPSGVGNQIWVLPEFA